MNGTSLLLSKGGGLNDKNRVATLSASEPKYMDIFLWERKNSNFRHLIGETWVQFQNRQIRWMKSEPEKYHCLRHDIWLLINLSNFKGFNIHVFLLGGQPIYKVDYINKYHWNEIGQQTFRKIYIILTS